MRYRCRTVEFRLSLDAFGGYLVGSDKDARRDEAERQQQHERLHDPGGSANRLENDVGDLQDKPRDDRVGDGYANHVAAFEIFKERHFCQFSLHRLDDDRRLRHN